MSDAILRIQSVTKSYPGVVANDHLSFTVKKGEIHALLGENGAGKSTLVKILYGLIKPDEGTMEFQGEVYAPKEPRQARRSGVGMVFQHFNLFDALSVAENIALGMDAPPRPSVLHREIEEVSTSYGLPIAPEQLAGQLSAGERQRVEIIRCLLQHPKLLIMDEPTSVLTPQEVDQLFVTLRKLRQDGTSILYISHKLEEIISLCDHATVMRRGKIVGTSDPKTSTAADLAQMMVGSHVVSARRSDATTGDVALKVNDLSAKSTNPFGTGLSHVSFSVRRGEIFGIGGVAGNGQDELLAALSGEVLSARDAISMFNKPIGHLGPGARRKSGLLALPEERLGHAAVAQFSLRDNVFLSAAERKKLTWLGFRRETIARKYADEICKEFDVRTGTPESLAGSLSGGNLQKFIVGREILQDPEVLIINQPTWGVDAAAAASIRKALIALASDHMAAIVVISQDLDELFEICHRFAALYEGHLSADRPMSSMNMEEVGLMIGGASGFGADS